MHERSYTKEDLRQILLGIALPHPIAQKPEPPAIQEIVAPEPVIEPKHPLKNSLKINTSLLIADHAILKRWPLLAKNIKSQNIPQYPSQDHKKLQQLQEENERLNIAISQLTQTVAVYKAKAKEQEAAVQQEIHKEQRRFLEEISQQKANFSRLLCDRKELDDTIAFINQEKITLAAKLKDLSTKHASQIAVHNDVQKRLEEAQRTSSHAQEQLAALVREKEEKEDDYEKRLSTSQVILDDLRQKIEEEQVKYSSLKELYEHTLHRLQELDTHGKQLEQHLARRVKECAHLLKQTEDEQQANEQLKHSISDLERIFQNTSDEFEHLKKVHEALLLSYNSQEQELAFLKKEKERLSQIEILFSQCEKIFTKTTHE